MSNGRRGERYALAIVGGGPAGLSTALFLHHLAPELASRIVVLEKATYPREKICAGAIGGRADRLLASIGVRVSVPSSPIRGIAVVTRDRTFSRHAGAEVGRVVRRAEFDAALADEVRVRGIALSEGAGVKQIDVARDEVRISLGSGDVIVADAVVGADGVGSIARRSLGIPRGRFVAQVAEIDTERWDADLPSDVVVFDLRDRDLSGYSWAFPTPLDGQTRMSRGVYSLHRGLGEASVDAASVDADVSGRLRALLGDHQGLGATRRFSERGLSLHEPVARPRVLLVGEAAGIDPVLGEGIAQAVFYGKTAAKYLVARLRAGALAFGDWQHHLARSRVGVDLRLRTACLPLVYGGGRNVLERWVTSSDSLARCGLAYFGGSRVPRLALVHALADLGLAALS